MNVTKDYVIRQVGSRKNDDGLVIALRLELPPKTVNGILMPQVGMPIDIDVPTTPATLMADLEAYDQGNTVPVSFGVPSAPKPAA